MSRAPRLKNLLRSLLVSAVVLAPLALVVRAAPPAAADWSTRPYWMVSPNGSVWPINGAPDYGSLRGTTLHAPIVGMSITGDSHGYWLVASDGGIFAFGDAGYFGSTGAMHLNQPIVGMSPTPTGKGYWLFAGDGGIFSFGDAAFFGSTGAMHLNRPIVGMTATPTGKGYWLFAGDGGIFSFGDAAFFGSTGAIPLNQPIVGMAPSKKGYWLVAADGGIFSFGDARYLGSSGATGLPQPVQRMVSASDGQGYWLVENDGSVVGFGTAAADTAAAGAKPARLPAIGVVHRVVTPGDAALEWALAQSGKPYQWGGAGPDTFDCSGLVLRAWQSVGHNLPRVAADQYNAGTHVGLDALQPGDLVFFADDVSQPASIHHVGMYVGNGQMVNAPYTGTVVRIDHVGSDGLMPLGVRP